MTGTAFAAYIRYLTGTNSTTFTDANIVLLANIEKDALAEEIVTNVGEGYFDMEETRDLEADERSYTFDTSLLKHVKYVAAKLDGTAWSYLTETDYAMMLGKIEPLRENSVIKEVYAGRLPEFYISGRELVVLSGTDIIAVTEGLKVVAEVYPEDITTDNIGAATELSIPSANTQHRLPRAAHKVWATAVSIAFKTSKDKPLPLTNDEKLIAVTREQMYDKLRRRNAVRSFQASVPVDDGSDY